MTLRVHKNAHCLSYLIQDNIVEIARFNQIFYYYISYISPKYDETGYANEYLTVMGRDAARIVYERIIERPAGQDFHSVTGRVDNCMKDFVRKQLVTGEAADGNRDWPNFSCEADDSEHPDTKTLEATYKDNLGTLLEAIGSAYSVDFWVENDGPVTYIFRTQYPRRGDDNSNKVVFSIARHNILTFEHWEDAGEEKTLVYVAGAGEAQNQIIEKYPAAEPTGADRKEAYVAATYIETAAQLEVYGDAFLDTFGQAVTGVSFKFYETESCKWGVDFEIGDLVTVWDPEFDKTEQIKIEEIMVRLDAQGREALEIRVGPAKPSAWDMLQAQRRLEPQDRLAPEHEHTGGIEGPKIDPADLDPTLPESLPYVIPAILLSTAAAEGVADSVIRSDATIVAFDVTVPNTIEPDDAAATGSIDYAARRDHEHAIVCAAAGNIAPDDTAAEGSATSFARSDHTHGFTCATPTDIGSANAEGAGTEFVRDNHVHRGLHSIEKAAAGDLYGDVTLSEGTNIALTQAGQDIEIGGTGPAGASFVVPTISLSTAAAEGASADVIRSDATIVAFDVTVPNTIEPDDVAATGAATVAARRDHEHAIVCATAVSVASANAEGVATSFARSNHTHQGIHSIQKAAAGQLYGDVTLSEGTGISLTQAAQDIEIAVSGVALFAFKTINCPAGTDPVADAADDTLNLVAGAGISITGTAATDTVTIAVTGVSLFAFKTIACPAGTNPVADATDDTLTLTAGANITITGNAAADSVTFAVTGVSLFAFKTINCPAGTDPVADAVDDTLNLVAGTNITITGTAASDTVTIGLTTDRLNSVDGVSNAGGNIDLIAGANITITPNDGANTITIAAATGALVAFKFVRCSDGPTTLTADSATDQLNLTSGTGILITGNAGTDTVTIELSTWGFAYKYIATNGATITADQIADTASILGGNAITTSAIADQITVAFDHPVSVNKDNNSVVLRSSGGHIEGDSFWIGPTFATDCIIWNTGHLYNLTGADPQTNNAADLGTTSLRWANIWGVVIHEGDHMFDEKACPACHLPFEVGDDLVYRVIALEKEGTRAIPAHVQCGRHKILDD